MKQIWKFPLDLYARQDVEMPQGASILSAQIQRGVLCVWALVSPGSRTEVRTLVLVATGEPFDPAGLRYVGTVQPSPNLVFHLFEAAE